MNTTKALLLTLLAVGLPLLGQPQLSYEVDQSWPQIPAEIEFGAGMGISVDGDGHIWVYNRGSHPMVQFDADGKVLRAWPENEKTTRHAGSAHGMSVAPDGGLWLVDREAQRVWKYTPAGEARVIIGSFAGREGSNDAPYAFNRPTGVAFDSKGNVYVSDGYKNTRVVKYSAEGKYLRQWGKAGTGNGEFNLVHDVTVDSQDFVYVADRGNKRVQVFNEIGGFVAKWEGLGVPWGLTYDKWRNVIWMCDGENGRITKLSLDGKILGVLGENGTGPGQFDQLHGITVDEAGNVYVCETRNSRVQKFSPKK